MAGALEMPQAVGFGDRSVFPVRYVGAGLFQMNVIP